MIAGFIRSHRTNPLVRGVARNCRRFINYYENLEYDPDLNGERVVLERIAATGCHVTCVFDVGANVGVWTLMAHHAFPAAAIHCFEILPRTAAKLRANTELLPHVIVNEIGLSDRPGMVPFRSYDEYDTLTTMVRFPHHFTATEEAGMVTTGDEYVRARRIEHVDYLKLDIEGAEPLALSGFSETMRAGKVAVIQFEYGQASIITKFLLRDFYELLTGHGYVVGKIYPKHVEFRPYALADEDFIGPNYLAVHRTRPELVNAVGRA
jgi:FkbM family methyltransferase